MTDRDRLFRDPDPVARPPAADDQRSDRMRSGSEDPGPPPSCWSIARRTGLCGQCWSGCCGSLNVPKLARDSTNRW